MGRKHLKELKDLKYWITEKSDGIRCMVKKLFLNSKDVDFV
jgi:hypothetical protein